MGCIKLDSICSKLSGFFNEYYILVFNKVVILKFVLCLF